jgi:6-phosphogluconolactonase
MTMAATVDVYRFETAEAVAEGAVASIARAASEAIAARGDFVCALAGGQTPRLTYQRLAEPEWRDRILWRETMVLWTDEKCVPPDDPGSNYRMAAENLLDHVPLPADNILRIRGEDCSLAEDERYERALHRLLANPIHGGRIDLVLLGVGTDGHTASLFPHSTALAERERWAVPTIGPEPYPHRITLTLPIINAARNVIILATGARKAHIVSAIVKGKADTKWPILAVQPRDGGPAWLVDSEACP